MSKKKGKTMTDETMGRAWQLFLMVLLLIGAGLGIAWIMAPKKVDGYYLSHGGTSSGQAAVCVYAHWTWHLDEMSFCTDDQQKAIDFVAKANASIAK